MSSEACRPKLLIPFDTGHRRALCAIRCDGRLLARRCGRLSKPREAALQERAITLKAIVLGDWHKPHSPAMMVYHHAGRPDCSPQRLASSLLEREWQAPCSAERQDSPLPPARFGKGAAGRVKTSADDERGHLYSAARISLVRKYSGQQADEVTVTKCRGGADLKEVFFCWLMTWSLPPEAFGRSAPRAHVVPFAKADYGVGDKAITLGTAYVVGDVTSGASLSGFVSCHLAIYLSCARRWGGRPKSNCGRWLATRPTYSNPTEIVLQRTGVKAVPGNLTTCALASQPLQERADIENSRKRSIQQL